MLARWRYRRQRQAFLVPLPAVVKLHHVNVKARVGGEAKPDADLAQQAGDKVQVVLAVLHHLLAARVLSGQREQKILAAHVVTLAQDFFHDLRNRHVLINGVLVRTVEQRQAWLQRQGIAGFICGGAEAFKAGHYALKGAHGLLYFDAVPLVNRSLQRQRAGLHQHHLFADGVVTAGELNAVAERFT
ncbi:Uncharacterised protein [Enterobacter cloacae]|nr:Uncharacterised protein [Enterobacter cloacae]